MTDLAIVRNTLPDELPLLWPPLELEAQFWDDRTLLGVILVSCEVTGSPGGHDALTRHVAAELKTVAFAELRRRTPGWPGARGDR